MDKTEQNLSQYRDARREYKKLNRQKIKLYFEAKKSNDFKNSKKFWNFYKTSIKLRGVAEFDSFPEELCWDVKKASTPVDQVEMFNSCFASIESSSLSSESESAKYIFDTFRELKFNENLLTPGFSFCEFSLDEIKKAVDDLPSSSSPGFLEANSFNEINNALEKYGLYSFQHRIFERMLTFSYKCLLYCNSPINKLLCDQEINVEIFNI
ncbi:hypothetical protein BpHYR1_021039 [Brachionus plicatilis]|uniref:Uncharacterized protein n=1 Tax=Brachionus plicatilis TaxID=10195 RepID=A0A3M7R042_BRAPC|nr:hypothetical protein BpHYR1_021039 [Brachionus plicatilis]